MRMLKILHINDVAGVAGLMSKYQKLLGHDSRVLYFGEDSYRFGDVYDYIKLKHIKLKRFENKLKGIKKIKSKRVIRFILSKYKNILTWIIIYLKILRYIKIFNPDIVHIHCLHLIPLFIIGNKLIEFHGTEIRNNYSDGSKNTLKTVPNYFLKIYKLLRIPYFYSTIDMRKELKGSSGYIPNPVDFYFFHKEIKILDNRGFYFWNYFEGCEGLKRIIELENKYNIIINVFRRNRKSDNDFMISYSNMRKLFNEYSYFIDRYKIKSLSKTALEALASGLTVINFNDELIEDLDDINYPDFVALLTISIYKNIIKRGL